jgi:hypothetical protein
MLGMAPLDATDYPNQRKENPMPNMEKLTENLRREGFLVSHFATATACCQYMNEQLNGVSIGFGGSQTVRDMGLYEQLATHNQCYWHWDPNAGQVLKQASEAQVYICSLNGVSENGELINIDGRGNRLAACLFGHEKIYFIIGANKIAPDYDAALWRARNIAAPLNAKRLGANTPCATTGHCHNCHSPQRICAAMTVYWEKPGGTGDIEVVIVDEELGF